MRAIVSALVVCVVAMGFTMQDAEAKRFGGGKSFGSKKMFSLPHKRSAQPKKQNAAPQQGKPAKGAGAAAAGGAARTGMMGMLGGLALGGLLGAMFFGGAFEGINFFDVLIFGGIAFLLFKLLAGRRRAMPDQQPAAAGYGGMQQPVRDEAPAAQPQERRAFDTDLLFKKDKPAAAAAQGSTAQRHIHKPAGFDEAHFIEGAKTLFMRMQKAWDEGDLGEIRQFTTDHVFGEIQDQFRARQGDNHTDVVSAHAELFDVAELDNELEASALFTLTAVENGEEVHAQEIWHFSKPKHAIQPTWYLDGIQQVEE